MTRRLAVAVLSALLLVLPFEPRQPAPILGLHLTLLEAVAAAATAVLLYLGRERLGSILRRPPLPVALLGSYVAVSAFSAATAPMNRLLAAKFVLRMAAAAVMALAVAAAPRDTVRRSLPALAAVCAVVAAMAIAEGSGMAGLDPFLDLFRAGPYWIGTWRRATAGSENPNLAAAILLYGLVPAVAAAALRRASAWLVVPVVALFTVGLLFTYSRGGLVALAAALAALALACWPRAGAAARVAALALATVVVATAAFAALRPPGSRLYAEGRAPAYSAAYAPAESFLSLAPGESRRVAVTLTNTGAVAWSGGRLGCSWRQVASGLVMDWQATLLCPVPHVPAAAPGEIVRLDAEVRAPAAEGRYLVVWDLVADGWAMSSLGVAPATVPVAVSRDPAAARPFPYSALTGTWRRGRPGLWRTALAMWRERPLTGIGPDNFRWAHAAYSGWSAADAHETSIPANSLFLEAAATTGALGLLALVLTFAATARAAWRALRAAAPGSSDAVWAATLLALTLGIVVHGMVDTLLGFTAHYLFFGIVVGAASAAERPMDDFDGGPIPRPRGEGRPPWTIRRAPRTSGPAAWAAGTDPPSP